MTKTTIIQEEINKIEHITPYLTDRLGRRVADLPPPVRKAMGEIKLAPKLTSSGLEPINPIIDWLLYARALAQDYLEEKLTKEK